MEDYDKLMVGDQSTDGRIIIADKDRLCYLVKSGSKGSFSIRTISKQLLGEFIDYYRKNPNKKAEDARVELKELSDIDKYEYGYNATLTAMAKMVLDPKNELVRKGIQQNLLVQKTICLRLQAFSRFTMVLLAQANQRPSRT